MTDPERYRQVVRACRLRVERHYRAKTRACLDALDAVALWEVPGPTANAVAGTLLHVAEHFERLARTQRGEDAPAAGLEGYFPRESLSKEALVRCVEGAYDALSEALTAIEDTADPAAADRIGLERLLHCVEHAAYHLGQVVLLTKLRTRSAFDFAQSGLNESQLRRP